MPAKTRIALVIILVGFAAKQVQAAPHTLVASPVANKLGLSLNQYAFSWKTQRQAGYRVLVASELRKLYADVGDIWDSGHRLSPENKNIPCAGEAFPDGAKIWWKVQIWDENGEASEFSEPSLIVVEQQNQAANPQRRPTHKLGGGDLEFIEGRHGQALRFGLDKPRVEAPSYSALQTRKGTTISAWIRPDKITNHWQCIYRKEDNESRRLLAIGQEGPFWGLWFGLNIGGYSEFGGEIDKAKLSDGQWHHVAASYDGKTVRLYFDGKIISEKSIEGTLGTSGSAPACIGSYGENREIFLGSIDDVRVYDHGLPEADLTKLAAGETDVKNDALAGHWKLDGTIANENMFFPTPPVKNRVVLVGDTLVSKMEKFGYLETALTAHWPSHDITFRNLGWPGDDVFGTARAEFKDGRNTRGWQSGPADGVGYRALLKHVSDAEPSTIIVGYGGSVAFEKTGLSLDQFKTGYTRLLDALKANGATLILLTPPRQEGTGSPLPDLAKRNQRLGQAAQFIRELGQKNGHLVIDLNSQLISPTDEPITENGVQLNDLGYRRLAKLVMRQLGLLDTANSQVTLNPERIVTTRGGLHTSNLVTTKRGIRFDLRSDRLPCDFLDANRSVRIADASSAHRLKVDGVDVLETEAKRWAIGQAILHGPEFAAAEKLRAEIFQKNLEHRRRLRPLNRTYIFLFRAYEMGHLAYEMEDFDRLVSAAEERIARLRTPRSHRYSIERIDQWQPVHNDPEHEVPRHIPDPDTADELASMTVADGFALNLFASSPILTNPINLNWDTGGRAWVSMSSTYPHIKPGTEPNDRIVILEDADGDGVAEKWTVFAEGLLVPHSVMPVQGGAYVCSATEFLFLADTDGDDREDERRVVFSGFGNADVHHMIHALRWAPWGELYFNQSIYINSFIDTRWGKRRLNGSGLWRFRPETERLEVFARGTVNPWGHAIDRWGQSFITDGAGGQGPHFTFPGAAFRSAVGAPRTLPGLVPGKPNGTGCEALSGRHFPEEWRGSIVENDFRANRTVRYRITDKGSGFAAQEVETLVRSTRKTYRPVDLKVGPDGALYIVDWYNAIIDHGEVDFHHPLRDKAHGRIWRLTAKDRPLVERPHIHGAPVDTLLDHLKSPEDYTRTQAKRELATRPHAEVLPKLKIWVDGLSVVDPDFEHHRLEALWLHGTLDTPDETLLRAVLNSPEPRARASAVRMLFHWRDRVAEPFELYAKATEDEHPRVRLEAVNMLRETGSLPAANIAMRARRHDGDSWLDYATWLTARELRDDWLPALRSGQPVFDGETGPLRFALEATGDPRATETLVTLIREDKIARENLPNVARTIAGLGQATEIDFVLSLAEKQPDLLQSIVASARNNETKPDNAGSVVAHLGHADRPIREAAAELVGLWKIQSANERLAKRIRESDYPSERLIAARALARLGQLDRLQELSALGQAQPVRIAAIAAWAEVQPENARTAAAGILVEAKEAGDVEPLFNAFINHATGTDQLATALAETSLEPSVAIAGTQLARASGRNVPGLIAALNKAGNLKPLSIDLSQAEREQLLAQSATTGDARRGAEIFRREVTGCLRCHQIGTQGGKVGPDLTSIGAYAQPAAILESILNPNKDIKQGYETIVLTRSDNTTVAGILQRQSDVATILRDPNDKLIAVPKAEVKGTTKSPVSLMPLGLTATLREDEFIDLMRYLISLGRQQK